MTTPQSAADIPQWTLADRMRKAREHAGLKQTDLAQVTGISRASITNYEKGKTVPLRSNLISWALATGVSLDWLRHGHVSPGQGGEKITWYNNPRRRIRREYRGARVLTRHLAAVA